MSYFVPVDPGSKEAAEYNRRPTSFVFTQRQIRWTWSFSVEMQLSPWPAIRMLVDGVPVTDYILPETSATQPKLNKYHFYFDASDGHHIVDFQRQGGVIPAQVVRKPFIVNSTGAPLPEQKPWTATTRFELHYTRLANAIAQLEYPGAMPEPTVHPLRARDVQPYSERLFKNNLFARRIQRHTSTGQYRTFVQSVTGDIEIEADQKYFYFDAHNPEAGMAPAHTLRDGPKGVGTLGFLYTMIPSPQSTGWYWSDVLGRVGFMRESDGNLVTLAGWRVKPGVLKASGEYWHRGIATTAERDFYKSKFEHVGDFSQVNGPKTLREPWGLASKVDPRHTGLHEFWLCDTLNQRILYLDHWAAHAHDDHLEPLWPPQGYVHPGVIGQTSVGTYLDLDKLAMSAPGALLNEPWDCKVGPDNKLYWTNFKGSSICRANFDGSNPEIVVQGPSVTDAQLSIGQRLGHSTRTAADLRALFPISTNPVMRPQAFAFDSEGNLIFAERYTYVIRKLKLTTREVTHVADLPVNGASQFGLVDINLVVDREGTCGPVDDILVTCWHNTDFRFAKDGTYVGRPFFSGIGRNGSLTGPAGQCATPNYAWGLGLGNGRMIFQGSAGGDEIAEYTKRLPSDPTLNVTLHTEALEALRSAGKPPVALLHGPYGQGQLGLSTIDDWGSWADDELRAFAAEHSLPADAFLYFVRWETQHLDYTEDDMLRERIAALESQLAAAQAELAAVREEVTALETKLAAANADLATKSAQIEQLQAKIAAALAALA